MAEFPTWLPVVAAALRDPEGRVLLQQRRPGKRHAGCWEFPGGKVEPGETPRAALAREVAEELAITISPADLAPCLLAEEHGPLADEAGDPAIVLFLYTCDVWHGAPRGMEGQAWGWFTHGQASTLPLAPMDADLLTRLNK